MAIDLVEISELEETEDFDGCEEPDDLCDEEGYDEFDNVDEKDDFKDYQRHDRHHNFDYPTQKKGIIPKSVTLENAVTTQTKEISCLP